MNHIYRLVWSPSHGAMVAVSELASSKQRVGKSCKRVMANKPALLLSAAILGALSLFQAPAAFAQDSKLADLQSVMAKYDVSQPVAAVDVTAVAPATVRANVTVTPVPAVHRVVSAVAHAMPGRVAVPAMASATSPAVVKVAAQVGAAPVAAKVALAAGVAVTPPSAVHRDVSAPAQVMPQRAAVPAMASAASPAVVKVAAQVSAAPVAAKVVLAAKVDTATVAALPSVAAARPVAAALKPVAATLAKVSAATVDKVKVSAVASVTVADRRSAHVDDAVNADPTTYADLVGSEDDSSSDAAKRNSIATALPAEPVAFAATTPPSVLPFAPAAQSVFAAPAAISPMAVPVVPPPSATPSGLIVGNGGVVGTATQLLGSTESALFNKSDPAGYITNGSLQVSNANFTQGYSTLNLLGLPLVNATPVGTVLTTVGGTALGGTGSNSHLTLIGGVTSANYISNINNGAAGGLLGLVLPKGAPAWASTCLNVLGILKESCWAVNAAQDYQVLVGDGASANGSKEVVIGTNAKHTLPTVDASTAFPGDGANDPNNPTGVPTADYAARLGHSVVIGDDASGTANAQTIVGAQATSSVANSVALGYSSAADRGAVAGYTATGLAAPQNSAGEVSIGAPGQERQITNVAAGSGDTDAVNVAQLKGVAATVGNPVQYDSVAHTSVTLAGPASVDGGVTGGTTVTNLHAGALNATSTDAVNGAQLFATDQNITNIYNTGTKYFHANSTGVDSAATGADSVAVGPVATASGTNSMAFGNAADASADNAMAFGAGANASMANSVALGAGSVTTVGAQAGYAAYGLAAPQTSLGEVNVGNRQITGVAAGSGDNDAVNVAQLKNVASVAGNSVQYDTASKTAVTLAGPISTDGGVTGGTTITNLHAGDLSDTSTDAVNGSQLFATNKKVSTIYDTGTKYFHANSTGTDSLATGTNSVAIGMGAVATNADDVAVGSHSITAAPNTGTMAFFGGTAAGTASSVFSIGAAGQERQLQNVAPGVVAAASTDAVNGSQLYSVVGGINTLGTSVATSLGGTSSYDLTTGAVTTGLSYGGGSYSSVQNVLNALTGGGTGLGIKYFHSNSVLADADATGTDSVAIGPVSTASGVNSVAMGNGAAASADDAMALGTGATASMANSVALGAGSVTAVGAQTGYTAFALAAPQTSLGEVNVGNRQVTGVAAGSAANDAVNVEQLKAVDSRVQSVDKLAVKYDADPAGNATNTITLVGDGTGMVGITNLQAGAETSTSSDAINGSQLWHWTQDTGNIYSNLNLYNDITNIKNGVGKVKYFNVNSTLGDSAASGSNAVAVGPVATASGTDSVAIGNGANASADNSVAVGAGSVADRANTVSVGSVGSERQITNVAAGTADTDAVNVGQLNSSVGAVTKGNVRYDVTNTGDIDYNNVTLGNGGDAGTTIHNVAAGVANSDAVNVGQFNAGVKQAVDWANSYTDQRVNELNNRASAGVAAAMAMAGLPQAYVPGKSMAAVAGSSFRGESSLAIGVSTISEGGRWVYKLSGSTDSRGDAGVTIGAGMQW